MPPSLARGEGSREAPGAEDGEAVVVLRTRQWSQEHHQGHHQDHHQDHHQEHHQLASSDPRGSIVMLMAVNPIKGNSKDHKPGYQPSPL